MELELSVLLALAIVGMTVFGEFEVETPSWRRLLKWGMITAMTLTLTRRFGHAALAPLFVFAVAGLTVHFWWCRRNGIHPFTARPRRRYYELRGWEWTE